LNSSLHGVAALTVKAVHTLSCNGWLERSFWKSSFESLHSKEGAQKGEPQVQRLIAVLAPAWPCIRLEMNATTAVLGRIWRTT